MTFMSSLLCVFEYCLYIFPISVSVVEVCSPVPPHRLTTTAHIDVLGTFK